MADGINPFKEMQYNVFEPEVPSSAAAASTLGYTGLMNPCGGRLNEDFDDETPIDDMTWQFVSVLN